MGVVPWTSDFAKEEVLETGTMLRYRRAPKVD